MLIPIKPAEDGVRDWCAIELQGTLDNRSDDSFADLALDPSCKGQYCVLGDW